MKCPDRWNPGTNEIDFIEPPGVMVPDTPTVYDDEPTEVLVGPDGAPIRSFQIGFCLPEEV